MSQEQLPYLEERKLVKRWNGPIPALVNLAFTLVIFAVTWWIFQDPRGIMRFYTPYVGYNYCRWWLIILIWMAYTRRQPFTGRWEHMLRRCLETGWKKIIVNKETLLSLAFLYYNKEIDK